jgi:hypothetical protein
MIMIITIIMGNADRICGRSRNQWVVALSILNLEDPTDRATSIAGRERYQHWSHSWEAIKPVHFIMLEGKKSLSKVLYD